MTYLFDGQYYDWNWLSGPYIAVTLWLLAIGGYALLINGARLLRAAFLLCSTSLVLVMAGQGLSVAANTAWVAESLLRCSTALVPMGSAGILAFVLVHLEEHASYGWLIVLSLLTSAVQLPLILLTDWYVADVWQAEPGTLFHVEAGPLLPVLMASALLWLAVGGGLAIRQLLRGESAQDGKQLKRLLVTFAIFSLSSRDVLLAYGIVSFPLSWLFMGVGTGFLLHALLSDESINKRSLDFQAPLIVGYVLTCILCLWLVWYVIGEQATLLLALFSLVVYLFLRICLAIRDMQTRARELNPGDTPRERLIEKYAGTVQNLYTDEEIADATRETLGLGLGCRDIDLIIPSQTDFGWTTVDGAVLSEEATPNPLLSMWLADCSEPIQRSELATLGMDDMRDDVESLMAANDADILAPLVNRDEILGILILGQFPSEHSLSREELRFLTRVQEHLTSALVYAQMHQEANARVAIQKEVALAAAIQKAFVSSAELVDYGDVQVSGLWAPATQCGGDWWSVHRLPDERVLVLVGDVTGHGVAAAMVTAAAKGCYDVAQRLMGSRLDLVDLLHHLDATVRLVGADQFNMTCSASLIDTKAGTVTFANAGHVAPYICSPKENGGTKLGALVARGNPLGATDEPQYKARERSLASGDIIIWYTDGIVECTNPQKQQFGDRRMQRLLRKLDQLEPNARNVRDYIIRAVAAFQGEQPPDDDITLVVAHVA